MLKFASEIRHLDGVRGNFEVSDIKEYVGSANFQNSKPLPQLIYSNVKEIVEQQQYVFESFWNRAIPSEQKIREIEYAVVPEVTVVIQSPKDAEKLEWDLLRKATKEVQIIYSTANAFYIQESTGTIQFLNKLAEEEEGISIKLLTPTDDHIRKSIENSKQHNHNHRQNNNQVIEFRNIAPTLGIKIKAVVVDRKYSLIMELKDDSKEASSTAAAIGWSTYSTSQATVLSYVSIFETLWRQTELYEQLEQSDRIKTEFINLAAHELRTPIMPIIGYAELLEEELEEDEKKRESVTAIIRNAKRLQRLAESILDVTKIENNTLNIDKKQLNLNDLILNVLDDIIMINAKEEKLKGHYDDHKNRSNSISNRSKLLYNATEEEIIIEADKTRLIQVIYNLLHNAMKFTKEGSISVIAEKNEQNNKKEVIVSVKDTGSGIDSEIFPRLFSKFASKSSKGTGLGLFISKNIIEAHGGKMWAENNADGKEKGAIFSFSLPIN
jgi:two-component system, OmpR family, sensor histidine kinase VicK